MKYFDEFKTQSCITAVAEMPTPIIGAINGATFTGGFEIALGCDFLVASDGRCSPTHTPAWASCPAVV